MLLSATLAYGQPKPVAYDFGNNTLITFTNSAAVTNAISTLTIPTKVTTGYLSATNNLCEADFKDSGTQVFTAAGYTLITNFQISVCHPAFTATDSNATLSVSGLYRAYMNVSLESASAASIACHMFTNGVTAVTPSGNIIGWDADTTQVADSEVVGFEKHIYIEAGTVVDWRIQCGGTETITWDHGTVGLVLK